VSKRLAQLLSVAFHPLLVPTYLVAALCYGVQAGRLLPPGLEHRGGVVLAVWVITCVLPGLAVGLLVRLGRVTSVELYERRQRPLPLLLAAGAFAGATLLLALLPHADTLTRLFTAMTISAFATLLITLRWKISAHGVGLGGAIGLFAWLLLSGRLPGLAAWAWLGGTAVVAGAVAWGRLVLRAHTRAQVVAGLALGTATALLIGCG
jgi:hypothetical protein